MLIPWLKQILHQRQWDAAQLAQTAGLEIGHVEHTLAERREPDFDFCFATALALEKQPERLLNMAGHLSDTGLQLAVQLANGHISQTELYHLRQKISVDDRRVILRCAMLNNKNNIAYNALQPRPHEFNKSERRQDRVRFALLVTGITVSIVVGIILFGLICAR